MKYIKYILGSLFVLALIFLLLGVVKPNISYNCEVTVNKPITESWTVMQDESKMADWLPGFQKAEPISGTPGTVGAVSMIYFDKDGEQMNIRETITGIVPNESISMIFEDAFMVMDYKITLTDIKGKTNISSNSHALGNSFFSKSIMVLLSGFIKGQEETNLMNLKKTIEQNE